MELRKVQLTGGSSLSITLPKTWVDKANLSAGDVVGCLEQPDGSLAVVPHARGERPLTRYEVDVSDIGGEYIFRKLIGAYLLGYDVIALKTKGSFPPKLRMEARRSVRRIIGLEVVEEEPNAMVIQDFLDPREFHMEKALRRMTLLMRAMQEEAMSAVEAPDEAYLQSIEERDDEVDRIFWLVNKQYHMLMRDASLASRMGLTSAEALNILLVARLVERTADHAGRIASEALALSEAGVTEALTKRIMKQARTAVDLFGDALKTFNKKDSKAANTLIDAAKEFQATQDRLLKEVAKLGGESVSHVTYILESISRTAAYAADVGEVAINHTVAKG